MKAIARRVVMILSLLGTYGPLACGGSYPRGADSRDPKAILSTCYTDIGRIEGEILLDCEVVKSNVRVITQRLEAMGIHFHSPIFTLVIDDDQILHQGDLQPHVGYYQPGFGITVTRDGLSLQHEIFHHVDTEQGIDTVPHPNWSEKGYFSAASDYVQHAQRLTQVQ